LSVIRRVVRLGLVLPILLAGLGAASGVARLGPATPLCVQAATTNHVGLVIEHGDGAVIRRCVGFDTPTITALAVLQTSGVQNGTESYGALGTAICQIDNEPPQYTTCLPASGDYWVLFISHAGGAWTNSAVGASSAKVSDGDVIGFRYDPQAGADPPPPSPAGTCPPPTTPTPAPTRTPTPSPTGRPSTTPHPSASTGVTPATATPTPAATPTQAAATPAAGVLGLSSPAASSAPVGSLPSSPAPPASFNAGLLIAGVAAVALIGLLGVQGLRRRRS
jgi:hypothetical protein